MQEYFVCLCKCNTPFIFFIYFNGENIFISFIYNVIESIIVHKM